MAKIDDKKLEQIIYVGTYLATSPNGNVAIGMPDGDIEVLHLDPSNPIGVSWMKDVLRKKLKRAIPFEGRHKLVELRARPKKDLIESLQCGEHPRKVLPTQEIVAPKPFVVDPDLTIYVAHAPEVGVWVITD